MSVDAIAEACVTDINDTNLQAAVRAAIPQMGHNSNFYQAIGKADALHTLQTTHIPVTGVDDEDIQHLYTRRLARASTKAYAHYEELRRSGPHGLCAYCQYGEAITLDHFAPKSLFATLSIDPWNLVPACSQCNWRINATWATSPDEQMLHPRFMPPIGRWLHAQVLETNPTTVVFTAQPDPTLPEVLKTRIRRQFDNLHLGTLYAKASSRDLVAASTRLQKLNLDPPNVQAHLQEQAAFAIGNDENHWRWIMYTALADSTWYCASGYRNT